MVFRPIFKVYPTPIKIRFFLRFLGYFDYADLKNLRKAPETLAKCAGFFQN